MSYNPTLFEASDWWKASNCGTSFDIAYWDAFIHSHFDKKRVYSH